MQYNWACKFIHIAEDNLEPVNLPPGTGVIDIHLRVLDLWMYITGPGDCWVFVVVVVLLLLLFVLNTCLYHSI